MKRRLKLKGIVWSLGVVPEKPLHEDDVELFWFKKLMGMVIHELFLERSIESLAVRIHLRHPGIRMIASKVQLLQCF